jgi:transcription-repair coupling factor (superfamily II helicase)
MPRQNRIAERAARKQERHSRQTNSLVSSASPLGLVALHLLDAWRRSKAQGLLFVSEDERRAEQLGAILHAFEPQSGVMVLPRLDTFPFDGLQPSRELTGRRASVLRRMAEAPEQILLVSTAKACLVRVPDPSVSLGASMRLRIGDAFDEPAVRHFLSHAGYLLIEPLEIAASALFLGHVLEIFPAGALGSVRLDYRDGQVREIAAYTWNHKGGWAKLAPRYCRSGYSARD